MGEIKELRIETNSEMTNKLMACQVYVARRTNSDNDTGILITANKEATLIKFDGCITHATLDFFRGSYVFRNVTSRVRIIIDED